MVVSWSSAPTRGTSSARAECKPCAPHPYRTPGPVREPPAGGRGPPGQGRGRGVPDLPRTKENCPQMARLVGVDLPRDKRLEVALTYIYGIGRTRALQTLKATGVSGDIRVHDLTDDDVVKLRDWIDSTYRVEGDLRREVQADIRRKVEIGSYQGIRHRRPFAAQMAAEAAARRAMEHGMRKVDVFVKGPGSGREPAIRSLQATGLEVGSIQDVTPVPHNGCRPPKRRRV